MPRCRTRQREQARHHLPLLFHRRPCSCAKGERRGRLGRRVPLGSRGGGGLGGNTPCRRRRWCRCCGERDYGGRDRAGRCGSRRRGAAAAQARLSTQACQAAPPARVAQGQVLRSGRRRFRLGRAVGTAARRRSPGSGPRRGHGTAGAGPAAGTLAVQSAPQRSERAHGAPHLPLSLGGLSPSPAPSSEPPSQGDRVLLAERLRRRLDAAVESVAAPSPAGADVRAAPARAHALHATSLGGARRFSAAHAPNAPSDGGTGAAAPAEGIGAPRRSVPARSAQSAVASAAAPAAAPPPPPLRIVVVSDTHGFEAALTTDASLLPWMPTEATAASSRAEAAAADASGGKVAAWRDAAAARPPGGSSGAANSAEAVAAVGLPLPEGDVLLHLGDFAVDGAHISPHARLVTPRHLASPRLTSPHLATARHISPHPHTSRTQAGRGIGSRLSSVSTLGYRCSDSTTNLSCAATTTRSTSRSRAPTPRSSPSPLWQPSAAGPSRSSPSPEAAALSYPPAT